MVAEGALGQRRRLAQPTGVHGDARVHEGEERDQAGQVPGVGEAGDLKRGTATG
ncbi:hypothetical protein AB0L34_10175 [Micromonospora sp. NPDC052213]|uniref:hypothetical protein n=1 Tax=Micromonospora sp. NPDC052213 TaxID=3155812 RepID=UPI00343F2816